MEAGNLLVRSVFPMKRVSMNPVVFSIPDNGKRSAWGMSCRAL